MTPKRYAIAGLIVPLIFSIAYLILSVTRADYSHFTKAISELGSVDAPNKWVWNCIGYILPGLLIAIFSVGLFNSISNGQGSKWPLIGFVLSGLFMSFSGVFPGDFENKESLTMLLHSIGSFGSYIFFLISAFTYPRQMKKSDYWKSSIKPTLLFTCLTIVFGAWPFIFTDIPSIGQRFTFLFYFAWIFYTAVKLYNKDNIENKANKI